MKKVYLLVVLVITGVNMVALAQQDPQFSQHIFIKQAFNPGYVGSTGAYCGTLLYRNQWTGFGGEPKTMVFTADGAIDEIHGGVGLTVISDQLGFDKNLNLRLAYAYRMDLGPGKLGLGVDFGMAQKTIDGSKFVAQTAPGVDGSIPYTSVSGNAFDMGFGAYYNSDRLFV